MRTLFRLAFASCLIALAYPGLAAPPLKDCDDLQLDATDFPASNLMTTGKCKKDGGQLCRAVNHAMGHRVMTQVMCYREKTVIGGIRGTLTKSGP